MLKIRPQQFEVFQQQAEHQFAQKLQHALAKKYPQLLSRFPDEIQLAIIGNMIDRAKRWGIDWKSSLVAFAELMVVIAPNFDQQADIRKCLENNEEHINQTIKSITDHVPKTSWAQAEVAIEDLPLFISGDFLDKTLAEQTANAMPLVLWDKVAALDVQNYAENACQFAPKIGLHDLNDAPLSIVVWRCLYGKDFMDLAVNPWTADIVDVNRPPRERIAMLKYRIALDHGRMV